MSASGSDLESRTVQVGRKRKAPNTNWASEGHEIAAQTSESDTDQDRAARAHRQRQSSVESGEISSSSGQSIDGTSRRLTAEPHQSIQGLEDGEVSSSDGDDDDDDDEDDDNDSQTGASDTDSDTAQMSISSGEEYEASNEIDHSNGQSLLRMKDVSQREQFLQYRYFHITNADAYVYCLCCAARGHVSATCPERTCTHCGMSDRHPSSACPQFRKCSRCRESGHDTAQCTNRTFQGVLHCDVCSRSGHVEEECTRLWSTRVTIDYEHARRIERYLMRPVCYRCGSADHFGDDCSNYFRSSPSGAELNLNTTWSAKHADHFIIQTEAADPLSDQAVVSVPKSSPRPESNVNWQSALLDSIFDDQRD